MSTITRIRNFVSMQDKQRLFTSRDLLNFGSRTAIDKAVSRLVHLQEIIRIIPGVFSHPERKKQVTVEEIAKVKAESFGRKLITHAGDIAARLGFNLNPNPPQKLYFATNGRSSSFRFADLRIHFTGICQRKFTLGDGEVAQVIRALIYMGKDKASFKSVQQATASLKQSQKIELAGKCAYMPAWLSRYFHSWNYSINSISYFESATIEDIIVSESDMSNYGFSASADHQEFAYDCSNPAFAA